VGRKPTDVTYSFVFDEARKLAMRGLDVHVVRGGFEDDSEMFGIKFHGLERQPRVNPRLTVFALRMIQTFPLVSLLRNPVAIYWENLYAMNVCRIIEESRVDLIHSHFAYPEGLVGFLAKMECKKPLIISLHGYDILVEPLVRYGIRLSPRYDALVRRAIEGADAVIVSSKAVLEEARKITASDKLHLIPNGVDTGRFNPHIDGSRLRHRFGLQGKIVVFTLRRHEPKYGIEYVIRSAPRVAQKTKDVFFIVGGDGSLRPYHEQLAADLRVLDMVRFTGEIPQDELPYYYAMSDMVVVPSLQEGFGLVVTEAMACGRPVIASRVGGITDQIIDGYNGLLVSPRQPDEIAEKILWLKNNPEEGSRLGQNGRRTVKEKFDLDKRIDQLVALYITIGM
jgi:glycosyltransferase involved in cell wall biosynthesis